jgi:uncharacterized protein
MFLRSLWLIAALAALCCAQNPTIDFGGLQQRAEAGDAAAQFELGVRYHEGQGVPQSYTEAIRWFKLSADQGNPDAEFNLGVMYEKGRGVTPNYEEAMQWYQKAAAQDYAPAEYNLGVMFDKARGVPLDFSQAMNWYKKAADQNYSAAQYNLGLLYYYGQGIPQNYVLAYEWVTLAVAGAMGDDQKKFSHMLEEMGSRMNPHQIEDAKKLAQEWAPGVGK